MKTVLITGCSSGFGLDTARLFLARGWRVVATMRTPREDRVLRDDLLPVSDRLRVIPLDVTDAAAIDRAVAEAGPVDALVNNAGIGLMAPLEGTSPDLARHLFETNTLGTIAMTRAVLPQFRQRRAGVVVNVASSVTLAPLPLLSVYTASKAAVVAFTGSLALELAPLGVRAHVVLPGRAPDTRFGEHARALPTDGTPDDYADFVQSVFTRLRQSTGPVTRSADVAEAVWRAVTDEDAPASLPAGEDALALAHAH